MNLKKILREELTDEDPEYIKIAKKLRKMLTQDILDRYDNAEYWDQDIIDDYLYDMDEDEKEKIIELLDKI